MYFSKNNSKSYGFSLVELLIVVAITVSLSLAFAPSLFSSRNKQVLINNTNRIVADLRATSERAKDQESGNGWWITFYNPSGADNDYYDIFYGTYPVGTFSSRIALPTGINFGNPSNGVNKDIVFSKATGLPTVSSTIAIYSTSITHTGIINISTSGKIDFQAAPGLVGYWDLDEGSGTSSYDASGNSNNITLTNSPTRQSGQNCKSGGCISFNGTNNYLTGGTNSLDITNNFTISAWVKLGNFNNQYVLTKRAGTGDNYALIYGYLNANKFSLWSDFTVNARVALTTAVNDTNWHHIAFTYDGATVNGYLDGALNVTSAQSFSLQTNSSTFNVGTSTGVADFLNGSLDDIQIYNKALSATDISNLYNLIK